MAAFGDLVDRSQQLAERRLGNQVPETIELARSARELGARAASAFGAGFGGSVWALVSRADAGFANEDGIVLGAATEDLDHPFQFRLAPDQGRIRRTGRS